MSTCTHDVFDVVPCENCGKRRKRQDHYSADEHLKAEDIQEYNVDLGEGRSGAAYRVTVGGVTLMHTCTEDATADVIAEGLNAQAAAAGVPATFSAQGARPDGSGGAILIEDAISPKRCTKTDLEQTRDRLNRRWVMPSLTDEQYAELKQYVDRESNYCGKSNNLLIIDDTMRGPAQTGRSPSSKKSLSDAEIVAYAGLEEHLSTFGPVDRMRATSLLVGDIRAGMNEHFPLSSIPVYSEGEKADMMNKVRRTLEGGETYVVGLQKRHHRVQEYAKCTDAQGNQIGDILADLERIAGVPFEYDAGEWEYQSDVEDHVLTVDIRFGDMCMWYIDDSQVPHDSDAMYATPQEALLGYLSQIREMFSQVPET